MTQPASTREPLVLVASSGSWRRGGALAGSPSRLLIAAATAPARFRTSLIAAFALAGLAIASIGLYGIVAYSVSQRTAEIGVRIALGAGSRDVMSLVLHEGVGIRSLHSAPSKGRGPADPCS
ncbi:MAG TPA: FtsX-like permease family protein [Vicinamibacterales bacterium]|nr:FtsX-like permease family protein [Vicinamibacterales bacterium]